MVCRFCTKDKPDSGFQRNRKVCYSCRGAYQRDASKGRVHALNTWKKRYSSDKEAWNLKVREYRAKRKAEGNPIFRNCVSDKYRKSVRFNMLIRAEVFAAKGFKCSYCENLADQIDHVVPLARGGGNELQNLVPACKSCNSSKQAKPLDLWLSERKVG